MEEELEDEGEMEEESLTYFGALEREYYDTIAKMKASTAEISYHDEFAKLFDAFETTYKHEQELIRDSDELRDIKDNLEEQILQLQDKYEYDENQITRLNKELIHAHKLADNAHAREQQAQEVIENMRVQIVKLNNELELKAKMGMDDDNDMGGAKTKEGFEREKQRLLDEIISLKQKLSNALSYSEELEHKNSAANLHAQDLTNQLEQNASEAAKQQRTIDKIHAELKQTKEDMAKLGSDYNDLKDALSASNKLTVTLETNLRDQKTLYEKTKKEVELLSIKLEKNRIENDMLIAELEEKKEKLIKKSKLAKQLEEESSRLRSEAIKMGKQRDLYEKKFEQSEKFRFNLENERNKLRNTCEMMEREIHLSKKQADQDKRTIENLSREKDILHKNIIRVQNVAEQHLKLIKIQEQRNRKLETDMNNLRNELANQKKEYNKMEKERNRAIEETMDLTQQVEDAMDEIKIKQQNMFDLKKQILETEAKLRQQQNLFEIVRADRNAFQKQLQEATAEICELKAKLKISTHQSEQLKEDIVAKEQLLLKEETILRKLNKEKENLKVEVQNGLNHISKLKKEIAELMEVEKRLTKQIQENDMTIRAQNKDIEQIMNDRDIIGAQLVRRNDELGLLYEKINILQITLQRGEAQYDQRIEDIRLLKLEIKRLRQERNLLSKSIANMTDLKHEVFQLERELAQERLKTSALEDELQHPLNIHRWRKLEGSDPQVLEMLQKIQILQKRLLTQTSEATEREKQLKETELLYLNLRQVMARQPGPEIKQEMNETRKALHNRGIKMKCLVSELNMYELQLHECKLELEKVKNELKEVKEKYITLKKEKQTEKFNKQVTVKIMESKESRTKFAGGGYRMAPKAVTVSTNTENISSEVCACK